MKRSMTKSELVNRISNDHPYLYRKQINEIVNLILNEIIKALADGGRVEIRGIGTWSTRPRAARIARNPKTGDHVQVDAKSVPHFRCGRGLHQRLNPDLHGEQETDTSSAFHGNTTSEEARPL